TRKLAPALQKGGNKPTRPYTAPAKDSIGMEAMRRAQRRSRFSRPAEPGSGPLAPPRSAGGALGGILDLPFAPAAGRQQQSRLAPIGFGLGSFSRSRAEALRRRRLLRQAAFQRRQQVNDWWRSGHFPGFDREPLHLGFNQLTQGLLVAVSIRRRVETSGPLTDDRASDRDHLGVEIPLGAAELRCPNFLCGS